MPHFARSRDLGHGLLMLAAALLWGGTGAAGGTYTRSSFSLTHDGATDSNLTETAGGIGLGIERRITIKLTDDAIPGASQGCIGPDVVACGVDTFSFFSLDTTLNQVMVSGVRLLPSGLTAAAGAVKAFNLSATPEDCYFHVDRGTNGYCASYVRKQKKGSLAIRYLQVHDGIVARNVDSAEISEWIFTSQCALDGDTFVTINSVDVHHITIRKVYASGPDVSVALSVNVVTDTVTNCSVAADGEGTICAVWTRGRPFLDKYFCYRFFDRELNPGPGGNSVAAVGNRNFYSYDDAPVVAYGPNRR